MLSIESPFHRLSLKSSTALYPFLMNEPFLVALEKEISFNASNSLPALQDLQSRLPEDSPWSDVLEYTFHAWNELMNFAKMKRLSIDTAERLLRLNGELSGTRLWIKYKQELLLTTRETKSTMGDMIRMECRMADWEDDLIALNARVKQVLEESEVLKISLEELQSPLSAEANIENNIKEAESTLQNWTEALRVDWAEFKRVLDEYRQDLEASLSFQRMLQVK